MVQVVAADRLDYHIRHAEADYIELVDLEVHNFAAELVLGLLLVLGLVQGAPSAAAAAAAAAVAAIATSWLGQMLMAADAMSCRRVLPTTFVIEGRFTSCI